MTNEHHQVGDIIVEDLPPAEAWRGTFSLIYAGAIQSAVHTELLSMVPNDVNLVVTTKPWSRHMLHGGGFDAAAFDRGSAEIVAASRETVDFAPTSFLCITGDLILAAMGPAWGRDLCRRIEDEVQTPVQTAMEVVVDALRDLGIKRIALVSPFEGTRTGFVRDYLVAEGIDVVVSRGVATSTNATIRDLPQGYPVELARRSLEQAGAASSVEAIYMPCPVWRTSAVISELEAETSVPVMTWMSTILWRGLAAIGDDRPVAGYGRLLEQPRVLVSAR
jgi:maleate isomerase